MGEVALLSLRRRLRPRDRLCGQGLRRPTSTPQEGPQRRVDPMLLNPGFRIGKQGIEKSLDLTLRGKPGGQKVEVDVTRPGGARRTRDGDMPPVARRGGRADAGRRHPEPGAGGVRRGHRRGGDDGLPHRRHPVPALGARASTPTPSSRADRAGIQGAGRLRPQAAVQQGADGDLSAGLDLQDHGGAGGAGERASDPHTTYTCNKVLVVRRPRLPLRPGATARWTCTGRSPPRATSISTRRALAVGPDAIAATARKFGLGQLFDIGIPGQKPGIAPDTA